jgi:hypothetical protein
MKMTSKRLSDEDIKKEWKSFYRAWQNAKKNIRKVLKKR